MDIWCSSITFLVSYVLTLGGVRGLLKVLIATTVLMEFFPYTLILKDCLNK